MYDIVFAENVTIESLNPHNFAMKNEYIDNLISTAMLIIPKIACEHTGIRIIRGFVSAAYIRDNYNTDVADYVLKHANGLALEVTWDMFDLDDSTSVGLTLIDSIQEPLFVLIDMSRKKLCVYRKYLKDNSCLSQVIDGKLRTVKTIEV